MADEKLTPEQLKKIVELTKQGKSAQEALNEAIKTGVNIRAKSVSDLQKELRGLKDQAALYENLGDKKEAQVLRAEQEVEIQKKNLQLLEAQIKSGEASGEEAMKLLKTYKAQVEEAEHLVDKLNNATEAIRKGRAAAEDLGDTLSSGIVDGDLMSLFNAKNMKNVIKAMRGGQASIGSFVKSIGIGLLTAFVQKLIEVAVAADQAESDFRRATGASDEMSRQLTTNYEATRRLGVGLDEMGATMTALYSTYTDFTMLNESAQNEISNTGALLGELGVSSEDFSRGMQTSTKAFGLTGKGAAAASRDIASFATEIGVTPQQLGSDFANMGTSLAKMGDQGVRAFKDLAIISKTTGLEMQKIINIADKFDTFEGAATQAGKLNAALGGNFVNAMDLMMSTNPADRFMQIRDAISSAGLTFDDMSYYQRKFYADAAGLDDVSDLAAMLSGDMSNLEGATEKSSAQYAELAKKTAAVQSITDEFKNLMISFIPVMTDVIDDVKAWMESLDEQKIDDIKAGVKLLADGLVGLGRFILWVADKWLYLTGLWIAFKFTAILSSLATFASTLGLIGPAGAAAAGGITAVEGASVGAAPAAGSLATGITTVGTAATAAWPGLLALGGAVLLIGGGVAIAALGIAEMAMAVSNLNGPQLIGFTVALVLFGIGLTSILSTLGALAPVAGVGVGIMLAFGGAIALIGVGVAIAAWGIGEMAKGFGVMFEAIDVEKMAAFGAFLAGLAMMAPAIALMSVSLGVFAVAMVGIAAALYMMPEDELTSFQEFLSSVSATQKSHFTEIASGIKEVNAALEQIPDDKAAALKTTMTLAATTQVAAGIASTAEAVGEAVRGVFGGRSAEKAIKVNVDVGDVLLDGDKVGKFVKKTMGEVARDGVRGTG